MNDHEADAAQIVMALERYLTSLGYGFCVISIAKLVREGDRVETPGAATFAVDPSMRGALPHEARTLRLLADKLDALFGESGAREATESRVEDATHLYSQDERSGN